MNWSDTVFIVVASTLANHLGLIEAIEKVVRHKVPIVNCSKCLSFWAVLIYSLCNGSRFIPTVAVSFLCAYAAVWLELLCGYIDKQYNKKYENLYTEETDHKTDTQD